MSPDDELGAHALEVGGVPGVRQLVEDDHVVTVCDQPLHEMRADEPGAAGDEHAHPRKGSRRGGTPGSRTSLSRLAGHYARRSRSREASRHARSPSRQCGSAGAPFSLRSTEYAGLGARAPNSSLVMRRTRQSRPASSKTASASSAHVHSPSAARCQTPNASPREKLTRRLREVADIGRAPPLVVDDRNLVALGAEAEHRADEVVAGLREEPRRANDPRAIARRRLAVELRPPVRREGARRVRLDVRRVLRPVEDVVRSSTRPAERRARQRASFRRRSPRAAPCGSSSAPSTFVHAAVWSTRSGRPRQRGGLVADVPGAPVQGEDVVVAERARERGPELAPGPRDQGAASRSERVGVVVLHRWATRGSFHATPCSSGSAGSYSSVTW